MVTISSGCNTNITLLVVYQHHYDHLSCRLLFSMQFSSTCTKFISFLSFVLNRLFVYFIFFFWGKKKKTLSSSRCCSTLDCCILVPVFVALLALSCHKDVDDNISFFFSYSLLNCIQLNIYFFSNSFMVFCCCWCNSSWRFCHNIYFNENVWNGGRQEGAAST